MDSGRPGNREALHLKEGVHHLLVVKIGLCWRLKDPEGLREFDLGVVELLYCWSVATSDYDLLHLPDLDWVGTVALGNCASDGQVSVLLVHVVGAAVGIVAQPDVEVLHPQRGFLNHPPTVDNFP